MVLMKDLILRAHCVCLDSGFEDFFNIVFIFICYLTFYTLCNTFGTKYFFFKSRECSFNCKN